MWNTAILLDSGFYLSLVHPRDQNAGSGTRILTELADRHFGLVYTTNLVIAETTTLTAARTRGNARALDYLESLFWGNNRIGIVLSITPSLELETWSPFEKVNSSLERRNDNVLSFVDVSLVILSRHHQIEYVASFDKQLDRFLRRVS